MFLSSALLPLLLLQVGPNPNTGGVPDAPEELVNRPPRVTNEIAPPKPTDPISIWLSECLATLEQDPARAHTSAQIRRNETTGAERVIANHCLGLAATELSLWTDAQTAFTAARDETPENELSARARFSLMAGNAALASGDAINASGLLAQAQSLAQQAASGTLEALAATDLARAQVAIDEPEFALQSLDTATRLEPSRSEAWLLKATLLRRLDRLDDAQAAIERASALSPNDPQVGLEAGVIAILSDREDAARASWQSVVDTHPGTPQAETAQSYLAQLGPVADAP